MGASIKTIGKYNILGILGRDTTGVLYKAKDPQIDRFVAVKSLRQSLSAASLGSDEVVERFKIEAKSAGNLKHPNIITIFEANRDGDVPFIVMDYVDGESLETILSTKRKILPSELLKYLEQLSSALDYAHQKQIVHGDIKPANILIDKAGVVFLLGFGASAIEEALNNAQSPDTGLGSPQHLSPEQIRGEEADYRSDLFSLAVVVFECLTGKNPFDTGSGSDMLDRILNEDPISASSLVSSFPTSIDILFDRALSKARSHRIVSATEFYQTMFKILSSLSENAPNPRSDKRANLARWSDDEVSLSSEAILVGPEAVKSGVKLLATNNARDAERKSSAANRVPSSPAHLARRAREERAKISSDKRNALYVEENVLARGMFFRDRAKFVRRLIVFTILVGVLSLVAVTCLIAFNGDSSNLFGSVAENSFSTSVLDAPLTTRPVTELSDKELLSVLVSAELSESKLLQAIRETRKRKLTGLSMACSYLLAHKSYVVRLEALKTMGELGDLSVVPNIAYQLNDVDALVRAQAAKSLGRLGDKKVLWQLTQRLTREEVPEVKLAINGAISQLSAFPDK